MTTDDPAYAGPSLTGKVAIVTGATRGLGAATARQFARAGATVFLTGIEAPDRDGPLGEAGEFVHHDVTSPGEWASLVEHVLERAGQIDVLVNNAGVIEYQSTLDTELATWYRTIAVNQTGPFLGIRAVAPHMVARGRGSIINIASVAGLNASPGSFAYAATKWAVRGMTHTAAYELGPSGVRVNAVLPGPVNTRMIANFDHEVLVQRLPLRRLGEPIDVARVNVWLASDESEFVTGADIVVDGGMKA